MLDFTSALYLGLRHPSAALRPWTQLTSGKPAALDAPVGEARLAQGLADLVGCERAVMGASTLHLFWDLFGVLAREEIAIYLDAGVYPIAAWGVERAAARGVPVRRFAHHDAASLARRLRQGVSNGLRPVVVADGFCPGCGRIAPIASYLACVRRGGGYLVVDDTQALGIFGQPCGVEGAYGAGGGGSLRWRQVGDPQVIMVSSLAKGFGAPVAVLAGSHATVERFKSRSETRVHTSPPSSAAFHAAARALRINQARGDVVRSRLARRVRQFKEGLTSYGVSTTGGLFPAQTLRLTPEVDVRGIHQRLLDVKIRSVLQRSRCRGGAALSFLITALHRAIDIERAVGALAQAIYRVRARAGTIVERHHEYVEMGYGTV